MATVEQTIIDYVCERGPHDPPTFQDLANRIPASAVASGILERMVEEGELETFEDEERGTVYVRDC